MISGDCLSKAPMLKTAEKRDRDTWVPETITGLLGPPTLPLGLLAV